MYRDTAYRILVERMQKKERKRDHLGDLGVDGRITLRILNYNVLGSVVMKFGRWFLKNVFAVA